MLLQQEKYEDSDGREVDAKTIQLVGTFVYIADGFFSWTCPKCRNDNNFRAHKVNGVVFKCGDRYCGSSVLLLRSDCEQVNSFFIQANTLQRAVEDQQREIDKIINRQTFIKEASDALVEQTKPKT